MVDAMILAGPGKGGALRQYRSIDHESHGVVSGIPQLPSSIGR